MRRMINMLALLATFATAFVLYSIKYDTRKLEKYVQQQERMILRAESDIVVLQAEQAHLTRPDRIERLARRQGLRPIDPYQYGRIEDLPLRGAGARR